MNFLFSSFIATAFQLCFRIHQESPRKSGTIRTEWSTSVPGLRWWS